MFHRTRLNIRPGRWGKHKYEVVGAPGDTMFWVIIRNSLDYYLRPIFYPGPTALNFRAAIWHTILCIVIISFWVVKENFRDA